MKKPALTRDMIPDPNEDHVSNIFHMWPPRREPSEEPVDTIEQTTTPS